MDVTVGGTMPLTVPSTTGAITPISGAGRLTGWSLRDVTAAVATDAEANVVAPAAGATVVTLSGLAGGNYTLKWTVGLQGAAAAADADNFQILNGVTVLEGSINPGAAGNYVQPDIVVTVPASGSITVKAIGAGTAGVTYSASVSLIPTGIIDAIGEITSGGDVLGEISLAAGATSTEIFGDDGPMFNAGITLTVTSGALRGSIHVVPIYP